MVEQQQSQDRIGGLGAALRLEAVSLGWMVVEAAVAIGAGAAAGSLLLMAFGADSIIELVSAGLLYYQLSVEARSGPEDAERVEGLRTGISRIAGYLLYALSLYVVVQAIYGLTHRHHAETSLPGLAVAVVAALGMPVLARAKLRVAEKIGSRALRADALESLTCGYLSWVLLGGLALNALYHAWWVDSAASLVIVPFLLREAHEAVTGECCSHCCGDD